MGSNFHWLGLCWRAWYSYIDQLVLALHANPDGDLKRGGVGRPDVIPSPSERFIPGLTNIVDNGAKANRYSVLQLSAAVEVQQQRNVSTKTPPPRADRFFLGHLRPWHGRQDRVIVYSFAVRYGRTKCEFIVQETLHEARVCRV